ncbi:hypothetical protein GCM10009799_52490 [Nocardiopsis rhodophaea]|uniref:Uncharacterized protein n=1 Tax=Nocardiopsis rhodophaea TaxID=280238 RepID=A0ABP5FAP2_9ACTN
MTEPLTPNARACRIWIAPYCRVASRIASSIGAMSATVTNLRSPAHPEFPGCGYPPHTGDDHGNHPGKWDLKFRVFGVEG